MESKPPINNPPDTPAGTPAAISTIDSASLSLLAASTKKVNPPAMASGATIPFR
ncbi:NPQTN class sortase B protein-sorting domain-containing protein [Pedobacter miscanthi]|uniref:NPQTN class sortase B protein-sorting domain-containing protein n=1 Tax=Pedobacter miscanthi TaxID=2259170 RepID=UPI003977324B